MRSVLPSVLIKLKGAFSGAGGDAAGWSVVVAPLVGPMNEQKSSVADFNDADTSLIMMRT